MSLASLSDILTASTPLGLILKVTLLVLIAAGVTASMGRRSAASRHFVWALGLGSSLALGVLSPLVPQLPLPIGRASADARAPNAVSVDRGSTITEADTPRKTGSVVTVVHESPFRVGGNLLLVAWAAGAAAVVGWLILGHVGLTRLTRRATRVRDDAWLEQLALVRSSMGVRHVVRLDASGAVGAPITWGFLRPIVVLPRDSDVWSDLRRRVVLEHELAHVARHDYLTQLIASVTCALYWFHPAVWFASRHLRKESERACDDAVMARGTSATDYAAHLLSVATGSRALRLTGAVAIGMARQSALEGRLLAALNPTLAREPVSARARRYSTIALGTITLPLAGVRAVPRQPTAAPPDVAAPSAQSTTSIAPRSVAATGTAREDTTFERSVEAARGERLNLDLGPGGDVDIRGWDEDRVHVRATFGGLHWRDMSLEITRDADGVVLRSRFARKRNSQSTDNSYEIRVPRRFDVRISSGGGNLTILDVEGDFSGTTGGGEIVLERLRGRASLATGGGDIRVSDVVLDGDVRTGGGLVTLSRVSGRLTGRSGSGPVVSGEKPKPAKEGRATSDISGFHIDRSGKRVSLKPGAQGEASASAVHISKAGGDITLEEAPGGAVINTGGGKVRVGRSAGLVDASTGGGDVFIGPVAGSVIAGTGAGTVTVMLADAGGAPQTVEIHAGVGRVIVHLPDGFDGTFDLETAYSQRFGRATRIESDWKLDRATTDEWDDREGTPRRYVRAHGSVGRGRGRVYIKTMNGDIAVRRAR